MPASFASTQLESDLPRFGNPTRFNRLGKCSSIGQQSTASYITARTNLSIAMHPLLYPQFVFLPLFLVRFSTVSLLTLRSSMRLTAYAAYAAYAVAE